jgi:type II secretory pathway pseudopilin PulG
MEIMVVVGIMGIILTMSVPIVWKISHRAPMNKAIAEIVEVCSNARARAILQGREVDLLIHPREGRFDLSIAAAPARQPNPMDNSAAFAPQPAPISMSGSGLSAQLDRVIIEDLDINKIPGGFRDAEQARVRFFPNGTADEMSLFLLSDRGQRCEILLEVTTGLANVEWEVRRFR